MEEKRSPRAAGKRSSDGPPSNQYRLYFLQGADNHISYSHEFEAEDDERAISIAESWREGRGAELWTGARLLRTWEGDL